MRKRENTVRVKDVGGIAVEITRKSIKNLRLRIRPDGRAALSVPWSVTDREADRFLEEQTEWLRKGVARTAQWVDKATANRPANQLLLFGDWYPVTVCKAPSPRQERLELWEGSVRVFLYDPEDEAKKEALIRDYRRDQLQRWLEERVPVWEATTGMACQGWSIREMQTRWGSCTVRTRTIRFSLALSERTAKEIDCVILHELCHLRVANHGPEFMSLMSRYMPSWQACQRGMKEPIKP